MSELDDFVKRLKEDPSLAEKLQKQEEFRSFKEKYNTEKATPLKCPTCAAFFQWPGSLWINKDDDKKFVCRKCKLEYTITCHTLSVDSLIKEIRKISKGEQTGLPSWLKE